MIDTNSINRKNFVERLASMSPQDINTLIREKGKKPKLVYPFTKILRNEKGETTYEN